MFKKVGKKLLFSTVESPALPSTPLPPPPSMTELWEKLSLVARETKDIVTQMRNLVAAEMPPPATPTATLQPTPPGQPVLILS